jgi:hypothetical protein
LRKSFNIVQNLENSKKTFSPTGEWFGMNLKLHWTGQDNNDMQ